MVVLAVVVFSIFYFSGVSHGLWLARTQERRINEWAAWWVGTVEAADHKLEDGTL